MLSADFADALVDMPASNGRALAYLAAHADIYRQEFHDNRVTLRCYLPRYLVHHIQEPDVNIRLLETNGEDSDGRDGREE
jgi:GTP-binding protein HflX